MEVYKTSSEMFRRDLLCAEDHEWAIHESNGKLGSIRIEGTWPDRLLQSSTGEDLIALHVPDP